MHISQGYQNYLRKIIFFLIASQPDKRKTSSTTILRRSRLLKKFVQFYALQNSWILTVRNLVPRGEPMYTTWHCDVGKESAWHNQQSVSSPTVNVNNEFWKENVKGVNYSSIFIRYKVVQKCQTFLYFHVATKCIIILLFIVLKYHMHYHFNFANRCILKKWTISLQYYSLSNIYPKGNNMERQTILPCKWNKSSHLHQKNAFIKHKMKIKNM